MQKNWVYVIAVVLLTLVASLGYKFYVPNQSMIYDFDQARDTQDVLNLMKDNWYWLISSPDYRADIMLSQRTPSHKQPQYFGKLIIKVMRNKRDLIGFVTYYKKSEYQGHLFLLVVDKKYRGKRFAKKLMTYALKELKAMGAKWVQLATREANTPARTLYKKLGLQEYLIEDGFVYFRKLLT